MKQPHLHCTVSRGWEDMSNFTQDFQQPFQLYRENQATYLQWMGDESLHQSLEGRLLLVHLLCKDSAKGRRKLFSPCISFRIAGSPGRPASAHSQGGDSLSQRDYLAIGLCAGFLVLLYLFAMVVLVVMKRKQRRDRRLREQFLNMPLPTGLGYKSSRLLGALEADKAKFGSEVRYSTKSKSFSAMQSQLVSQQQLPSLQGGPEEPVKEKIYDITKKGSNSGSESDASSVMELNEKLLEAHKKVSEGDDRLLIRTFYVLLFVFPGGAAEDEP